MADVRPITDDVEISNKTADDMYVELQQVLDSYAGRFSNAEAIGVLYLCIHRTIRASEEDEDES